MINGSETSVSRRRVRSGKEKDEYWGDKSKIKINQIIL